MSNTAGNNNLNYKKQNEYVLLKSWLKLIPLIIIIIIIPLIVRGKSYDHNLNQFTWYYNSNLKIDFFLYYKQWILVSVSMLMLISIPIILYIRQQKLKLSIQLIPLIIYIGLSILSTVLSKYRYFTLVGIMDHFESIFALLSYVILVIYICQYIESEKEMKVLIIAFAINACFISVIGLLQFIGRDFFTTEMGKKLVMPKRFWENIENITFSFEKGHVYSTLFNPNYVGVYVALLLPLFIMMMIFSKKIIGKLAYLIISIALVVLLLGSKSLGGYIGLVAALLVLLILMWRRIIKKFVYAIPIILILLSVMSYINIKSDNYYVNKIKNNLSIKKEEKNISDIKTEEDYVSIIYKGNEFNIQLYKEHILTLHLYDQNDNFIYFDLNSETGEYLIQDERFPGFKCKVIEDETFIGFYVDIDDERWIFTNLIFDDGYYYLNRQSKLDKIKTAPVALFKGYETFGSTRGYIWGRTIPLLYKYFFIGSGPDTFTIAFPQQDYVSLNYYFKYSLVTKPHNMYLQIAVQTGVLSLIAFLSFYFIYAIDSIKLLIKGKLDNYYSQISIGVFAGTVGYMVAGLGNDSTIAVAPLYWILMGIGIVANNKAKQLLLKPLNSGE